MRLLIKIATYTLLLLLLSFCAISQTLTTTTDRDQILIGEQLVLEVRLDDLVYGRHQVVQWFNLPAAFNSFELVKAEKIDTIKVGASLSMSQRFILTSFDSGHWRIPPIQVLVADGNNRRAITTDSIGIDVLPVDVSAMEDYHPIKPIIEVKERTDFSIYIIGAVIILGLLLLAYLFRRQKKKRRNEPGPVARENAYDWAKKELKKLQQEEAKLSTTGYLTQLDNIYRTYLAKRNLGRALHATSDELMIILSGKLDDDKTKRSFFQFMRLADAVKFAKYPASEEDRKEAFEVTSALIEQMERER